MKASKLSRTVKYFQCRTWRDLAYALLNCSEPVIVDAVFYGERGLAEIDIIDGVDFEPFDLRMMKVTCVNCGKSFSAKKVEIVDGVETCPKCHKRLFVRTKIEEEE